MAQITYTLPDDKIDEFKRGFLKVYPTPEGMTDAQWIKQWGKEQFLNAYMAGKQITANESVAIEKDLIK